MGETRQNCDGSMEQVVNKDMISGLPEDLLVTILRYVPIKNAVATMILSKRWRFIWTMMPILEYGESDDKSKKSVWWFLDKSMQLHKAPVLAILYMTLGPRCPSDADVGKWIAKAVDHGVVRLKLALRWSVEYPTRSLPKTLYFCESLESLALCHKILVDVPSTACLPSLTNLHLICVVYKNEDSLINLLASCPVLKVLFVCREKDDNVKKFIVKSPCLLDLRYVNNYDVEDQTGRCLVIDTPALTKLDFFDISGETCSIENPACFEKVHIRAVFDYWSIPDTDKFLRSFSKVLSLVLDLSSEMVLTRCGTIKFNRLIDCTIFPWDTDWMDSLVSLLLNTPKLKSLTINYEFTDNPPITSISWSESSYDPECLSSSLENFALVGYGGEEEEKEELVEYILTNAKCLKTATIFMKSTLKLAEKDTMMEKLRAIPRISKTSELLFKTLIHN